MNAPIALVQPPNTPKIPADLSKFHSHIEALKSIEKWSQDYSRWAVGWMGQAQTQLNTQVQGVGDDLASAATIAPSSVMHRVTGTATVTRIVPPPGFSGPIFLVATDGFTLSSAGGNIANTNAVPVDALATLVYFPPFQLWYVTSVSIPDGSITTSKLASGAVTTPKLAAGAATEMTSTIDNTSQNITPYDSPVTVVSETVTIDAATDQVHITGRINATASNIQSADAGQAFLYRDAVLLDTAPLELTLSTTTVVGGHASAAFSFFDTGVSGPHTYSIKLQIHNGSGNGTYAVTKDSAALIIQDLKAQS